MKRLHPLGLGCVMEEIAERLARINIEGASKYTRDMWIEDVERYSRYLSLVKFDNRLLTWIDEFLESEYDERLCRMTARIDAVCNWYFTEFL